MTLKELVSKYIQNSEMSESPDEDSMARKGEVLRLMSYYSWWRDAGRGWIKQFRGKRPDEFKDAIENKIALGLKGLEQNEKELVKVFRRQFVETTGE